MWNLWHSTSTGHIVLKILSANPHEVLTTWVRDRTTNFIALSDYTFHCPFCSRSQEIDLHLNMINLVPQPVLDEAVIEAFDNVKCEQAAMYANKFQLVCERCNRAARIVYNDYEVAMGSWVFVPVQALVTDSPLSRPRI